MTAPTDLGEMDAAGLHRLFRSREASPVEAAEAALARIERFNPLVNAFAHVTPELALASARQSEARWMRGEPRGPLDGVPATMKELTPVIGIPTRRGSGVLCDHERATSEPEAAARLRRAGVTILGTTSSPELGWKGVTHGPGIGVTRNPWNTSRAAGGSSGGAAVAAALNMGVIHDGSDGAGSIRIPASFCGVFGLKPSFGWIPPSATVPQFELAHRGPLARRVRDVVLFMEASAGYVPDAAFGYSPPVPDWQSELGRSVKGIRIGFSRDLSLASPDGEVVAALERAAARFAALGCVVEEADPGFDDPHDSLTVLWSVALASSVKKLRLNREQEAGLDPGLIELVRQGQRYSADDYVEARLFVGGLRVAMAHFHEKYDVLLLPTMPIVAFEAGHDVPPGSDMQNWTEWSPFTYPFNMTGQPAASVPCGRSSDGMPIGMQLVARWYEDGLVMRLAHAYEEAFGEAFPSAPRQPVRL